MKQNFITKLIGIGLLSVLLLLTTSSPALFSKEQGLFETKARYEIRDGQMFLEFELINKHSSAQHLQFGSGQQFEIIITNEAGEEVYRYSDGRAFTMALIAKTLEPGESLKWHDSWVLTNKSGEKLSSGQYTIKINIMVIPEGEAEIQVSQLTTTMHLNLDAAIAQSIIEETASEVIKALCDQDAMKIADYVHPTKGVRFTPYTYVALEHDLVFDQEAMNDFFSDQNQYLWGYYDGTGYEILLTPAEYYKQFIYSQDFVNADQVGYNEVLSHGNMLENQFEVYDNPIIVEYYFPGFNLDYAGMDWKSLRLVFEEYEGSWRLTGIIHNQWTI